jgi:hypothetical protein
MIFNVSLRSETSEKTGFFRFEAKNFSHHFRFVSLRAENERRTLARGTKENYFRGHNREVSEKDVPKLIFRN